MFSQKDIIEREIDFMKTIHQNTDEKLMELQYTIEVELDDLTSYEALELVTKKIMWDVKKSDRHFLLWLHFVGHYINEKHDAKWVLIRREWNDSQYFVPFVMDKNTRIWRVGDFCPTYYYKKKRMRGISFNTFYKLEIEQYIAQFKFHEINISADRLIELE